MKIGLIWTCLLICAALACSAAAQSTESLTYDQAIALENPAERITALQQILKTRPAHEQADSIREAIVASWAQLGEIQLNENNIEKAVANFRQSITALPEKVTDLFFQETVIRIPLAVSVRGYRNESVGLARLLEKRFANESQRLAALGEFFMTVEAPADAIRSLEAAAKTGVDDARMHRALGAAYRMGLRLDDAIAEYQLAIGLDPNDKRAYYELANLYRAHGAYADAINLYRKQLEIEPKHAPSFKGLALTYLAVGDEDQMTAALNQARDLRGSIEEITGDIYLQTQMAFYYLKQNKLKQSRQAAEYALMVEPRYAWGRLAAAEVDLAEGRLFEAERNLLAAERYAGFPTLFFTRGKLYLSVEDFDGAIEQFAKAFSVSGSTNGKDLFSTRLGDSLEVKNESLKELLAREHQAAIFLATSPTVPEQFRLIESLMRFNFWLGEIKAVSESKKVAVSRKQMEQLDRAAMDFVEAESTRRPFRSLYIAQKLSQAGIATGLAVELAEQALAVADIATDADGSLKDYPNYDRSGRLQIFRGRALDAKGWALFKAGKDEQAATILSQAVQAYGELPESKRAHWHLATVQETLGDMNAALDSYIAGYEIPEIATGADVKRAVIEVIYRKVNGSLNGFEERLRRAGIVASTENAPTLAPIKKNEQPPEASKPLRLQPKPPAAAASTGKKSPLKPEKSQPEMIGTNPAPVNEIADPGNNDRIPPSAAKTTNPETDAETLKEETASGVAGTEMPKNLPTARPEKNLELPNPSNHIQTTALAPAFVEEIIYLRLERNKPSLVPPANEEPPPPPVKLNTRPRRVSVPVDKPKPDNQ